MTPVNGLSVRVTTMADVEMSNSPKLTDSAGHVEFNLPPGEYKVIIANITGYTFEGGTTTEPLGSPVAYTNQTILNVTIAENATTSGTGSFSQNIV